MLHFVFPLLLLAPQLPHDATQVFEPGLIEHLAVAPRDEQVPVIIVMQERYDLQALIAETGRLRKSERRARTMERLIPFAEESQAELVELINQLKEDGAVTYEAMLWNVNAHCVTGTLSALAQLAEVPGVGYMHYDPELPLDAIEDAPPAPPRPLFGALAATPASVPYVTSFESGSFDAAWDQQALSAASATVTSNFGPAPDGIFHVAMDGVPGVSDSVQLTLHLDMSGGIGAALDFDLRAFGDASGPNDGLFISEPGKVAKKVLSFNSSSPYQTYSIDLGQAAINNGVALGADFQVQWHWSGTGVLPNEGFVLDAIDVQPTALPVIPPEPNITGLQAPQLWALGIEGQGALILNIDSGTVNTHPALKDHIWVNPGEIAGNGIDDDANGKIDDTWGWDFASNDNNPSDGGHGTNTAGIVMGDGTGNGGVKTGMAPDTHMAVARINAEGDALEAYQYAVTIGVNCITSSDSFKYIYTPDYHMFRLASETELAAGIIHANSIGNQGTQTPIYPIPYNISTPGNNPGPWRHPQQVQTGGISSVLGCAGIELPGDTLYNYSGKGPSAWEDITVTKPSYPFAQNPAYWDYPYAGGSLRGLLKPDMCAYTNVPTTSGSSGYTNSFGGTSAATPHLGGALCLMVDTNESVPPRQISQALQETALDLGPAGKDVRFGAGKVQVFDAAMRILACVTAFPTNPTTSDTVSLDITGPTGDAWFLVFGTSLATAPTGLGFDLDIASPVLLASGTHTGYQTPTTLNFPLGGNPALSGLTLYTQLATSDAAGATGGWLVSLVETIAIQ